VILRATAAPERILSGTADLVRRLSLFDVATALRGLAM